MSPVLGRRLLAPRSRLANPGAKAPGMGKGTTASGKPTKAPRATGPHEARHTTRGQEARQRGTPPATTAAHGQMPGNNGRRGPQIRTARATTTQPRPWSDTEGEARPSSARETGRPGLDRPGGTKQQEPPPPGLQHPGTTGGGRPGQDHPGRNKQSSGASPRPRSLGFSTPSPRPRPLLCIAASPWPCPHLVFSAFPRPRPPLRFAASPRPRPRGRLFGSPWRPLQRRGRSPRRCRVGVTTTRLSTRSQEQTTTWSAQDWNIRGKTRRSGRSEKIT